MGREDEVELTAEDELNGWTLESLREYVAERERACAKRIFRPRERPRVQNSRYSCHHWRD